MHFDSRIGSCCDLGYLRIHLFDQQTIWQKACSSFGGRIMDNITNNYLAAEKQQVRSIVKGLLTGSLLILAVGVSAYLLLFALMMII